MKRATILLAALLLVGCGNMQTEDFAGKTPDLDVFTYFAGKTRAWGIFEDRFGKVRRQFQVDINGTLQGDRLVLEEDFVYDDGELARRVWTIRRDGPRSYVGTAPDVIGEARGEAAGNALRWRYSMELPIAGRPWHVRFDDWMFLQPGEVMINRARVYKLGIELGAVTLFFSKS